ncbi:MAG: hypoxanthine phosphoribosyltransferase [Acutalibacteraceae bacterium]
MVDDISEVFFSREQLEEIVSSIGAKISEDYKDKKLMLVCVLKGSVMFMSDLMKHITIPCSIDFLAAESYGSNTKSSGEVKITKDISGDIRGYDILIVEDILDSGKTLKKLTEFLAIKEPASISICTLLDKPARRTVDIEAKYIGAEVQDQFVVGYGLDFAQRYRNLPFIGILRPEAVERIKAEEADKTKGE